MHLYDLLPSQHEYDTTMGAGVFDTNHLFPPLVPHNSIIFYQSFGIEFDCMGARLVRPISPYEFTRGFGYSEHITHKLAECSYFHLLLDAIPSSTSDAVLRCLIHHLHDIRTSITVDDIAVDDTTPFAAHAATAQVLFNGATGISIPDNDTWMRVYADDQETALIRQMILQPCTITKDSLLKLHYVYRGPIHRSQIMITENGMLATHKPIKSTNDSIVVSMPIPVSIYGYPWL